MVIQLWSLPPGDPGVVLGEAYPVEVEVVLMWAGRRAVQAGWAGAGQLSTRRHHHHRLRVGDGGEVGPLATSELARDGGMDRSSSWLGGHRVSALRISAIATSSSQ